MKSLNGRDGPGSFSSTGGSDILLVSQGDTNVNFQSSAIQCLPSISPEFLPGPAAEWFNRINEGGARFDLQSGRSTAAKKWSWHLTQDELDIADFSCSGELFDR